MEGFGIGLVLYFVIFFFVSILLFYCLAKILQLLKVKAFSEAMTRWSFILGFSILQTYFLNTYFIFSGKGFGLVLIILCFLALFLKLLTYYIEDSNEQTD